MIDDPKPDEVWIEKTQYKDYDFTWVQIFEVTPDYMENRSVAFTVVRGRNAVESPRNRRIFTLENFLASYVRKQV